jgi:hypothetical protein
MRDGLSLSFRQSAVCAIEYSQDGAPLEIVETALLLGSLRLLIRPADAPRLAPIRSLACFRPLIEELCELPAPENYREYLRGKFPAACGAFPVDAGDTPLLAVGLFISLLIRPKRNRTWVPHPNRVLCG